MGVSKHGAGMVISRNATLNSSRNHSYYYVGGSKSSRLKPEAGSSGWLTAVPGWPDGNRFTLWAWYEMRSGGFAGQPGDG